MINLDFGQIVAGSIGFLTASYIIGGKEKLFTDAFILVSLVSAMILTTQINKINTLR